MTLDTMRRRFALDEEASVEGGMSPTTTEEQLAQFATMDAQEEANAAGQGASVDDLRFAKRQKQREQEYFDAYGMPMETKSFVQVPPSMRSPKMKADNSEAFAAMAPMAERLMASRKQGLPEMSADFVSLQKTMSPGSFTSPIPVARPAARDGLDAEPGVIKTTMPAVDAANPAGKAGQPTDTLKPPAPPTSSAGGDDTELSDLRRRLGFQQAFEGLGSAASGKNLYTDGGILADRMKQIEALRAKKAQAEEDRALEAKTWGASNRGTLAGYIAQFKDRPEVVAALKAMEPAADTTKPGDFNRNVIGAITTPGKVAGMEAGVAKTNVQIPDIQAGTAGKVAKTAEIGPEGESKRKLRAAQVAKIYKDMELAGTKLAIDERKTIEQAQQSKDPYKKLESLNTIADKKEFGGFTTLAGDLGDLERAAPGFVTRGEVPEWLTREQQLLGQNWPTSTDPRVVDFLAAYGKVANEERHRQYGSAQTDGELRAFMQQLNASPLSAGPQVLAQQVKRFGQAAGRVAKGRLTRYNNVFGAENVDTVFAPEWKPLFDAGGVFAAQGSPFVATRAPAAAGGIPEAATVTIKRKVGGKIKIVPAVDRAKWLANPDFEEAK